MQIQGIMTNVTGHNEHVREVERYIRTVKERVQSTVNTLPFKKLLELIQRAQSAVLRISKPKQWVLLIYWLFDVAVDFWHLFNTFGTHHMDARALLMLQEMDVLGDFNMEGLLRSDSFSQEVEPFFHLITKVHSAVVFRLFSLAFPTIKLVACSSDSLSTMVLHSRCWLKSTLNWAYMLPVNKYAI